MRTYERTHPWLSFHIDLRKASPHLWMNLGEAASKCEHIADTPLRPKTAERLHLLYLAKGAAATTAIEGNPLTEKEVLQHLEGRLKVPPSKEYLTQEIDNIVTACNQIANWLRNDDESLTANRVCELNRMALEKLQLEDGVVPGNVRTYSVVVGNFYRGAPPEDCEYLLVQLCEWLTSHDFTPPSGMGTVYAIIKAIVAHLYLAWIHPFGDGNGRTARLMEFQILLSAGVPTPAAHLLSNHYNQTRSEYYRQLDSASKLGGDIICFLDYAVQGFVEGLREQLSVIKDQQWDVVWRNYIHELFHEKNSSSDQRRRHLALDLGIYHDFIPITKITDLTPRLAKDYATKTSKTLQRDLAELEKMGLAERNQREVRLKREIIFAFLPWRKRL
ncbi:Fic family protein [bacterium]|nr:Fic family protein [bacterium]